MGFWVVVVVVRVGKVCIIVSIVIVVVGLGW